MNKLKDKWIKTKKWVKKHPYSIILPLLILVIAFRLIPAMNDVPEPKEVSYVKFEEMLKDGDVKTAEILLSSPTFIFTNEKDKKFVTDNPKTENFKKTLLKADVDVMEIDKAQSDKWANLLRSIVPLLFIGFLIIYLMKSMKPVNTKKKSDTTIPKTMFDHIAGNEEAKEEMKFLVDFLKNPKRYANMGAKLPKGVILYGEPGTGKTLTAKAIAGEAKVPFFSMSGSDFTEMYVGVGPKRIRSLFEEARKQAPAIIFIDEIDALGTNRDISASAEDKKTLNAILNEMDGFADNSGIIVIGATNRLDDLDSAFIRPGRFDKQIKIALPDLKGRLAILELHAKNKKIDSEVSLENLAKITRGMSGAFLETILNEATILATTRNKKLVTEEDIDDAYYKMIVKGHKKKRNKEEDFKEMELVAWHEAGHALVAKLLDTSNVPKVTITPSTTGIGGFALIVPKKDKLKSKTQLYNQVKELYAGRVAEYLLLGSEDDITYGASNDIEKATILIQDMIIRFGMNKTFGMINLSQLGNPRNTDLSTNELFVQEAIQLSNQLYVKTLKLLRTEKDTLRAIAERLIEKETILEDELDEIIENSRKAKIIDTDVVIEAKQED